MSNSQSPELPDTTEVKDPPLSPWRPRSQASGLLGGARVMEFSQYVSGPWAGQVLSDAGADVIKIEPLTGDAWRGHGAIAPYEGRGYIQVNRGKRGIALDLKHPQSACIIRKLTKEADAVISNLRPDTLKKLGIDYATLKEVNPMLVYVMLTALEDPEGAKYRAGYDLIGQAASGLMTGNEKIGTDDLPQPVTTAVVDFSTGYAGAFALSSGLLKRDREGRGSLIEASMMATAMGLMSLNIVKFPDHPHFNGLTDTTIREMCRSGSTYREINDFRMADRLTEGEFPRWWLRCYDTADAPVAIAVLTEPLQFKLFGAISLEQGFGMEAEELAARIQERLKLKTAEEWVEVLSDEGVPIARVAHAEELVDDAALLESKLIVDVVDPHPVAGPVRMVGPLLRVDGEKTTPTKPAPTLGQHTNEILEGLGFDSDEVQALREAIVVL